MSKNNLLLCLFLLAMSGLMLHYRVHPYMVADPSNPGLFIFNPTKFVASFLPLVDVILVTALFMSRKTAVYGYVLNGMLVIYGTVLMAHYSIAEMVAKSIPLSSLIIRSTLPDIGIAWGDFLIGKALYDLHIKGGRV